MALSHSASVGDLNRTKHQAQGSLLADQSQTATLMHSTPDSLNSELNRSTLAPDSLRSAVNHLALTNCSEGDHPMVDADSLKSPEAELLNSHACPPPTTTEADCASDRTDVSVQADPQQQQQADFNISRTGDDLMPTSVDGL